MALQTPLPVLSEESCRLMVGKPFEFRGERQQEDGVSLLKTSRQKWIPLLLVAASILYVSTLSNRISSISVDSIAVSNKYSSVLNISLEGILEDEDEPAALNTTISTESWEDYWNRYHLGDLIKFNDAGVTAMVSDLCKPQHHDRQWTIVCQYRNRTDRALDIDTLVQVLDDQLQELEERLSNQPQQHDNNDENYHDDHDDDRQLEFPSPDDEVVVHLRLGDGLCTTTPNRFQKHHCRWDHRKVNASVSACHYEQPDCWNDYRDCYGFDKTVPFALPQSHYEPLIETLQALIMNNHYTTIRQVTLVSDVRQWGWGHDPRRQEDPNYEVDAEYRRQAGRWFSRILMNSTTFTSATTSAIKVVFRNGEELHRNPDQDFQYMSAAKWFVPAGGGYSQLISQVVQARGGTVMRPLRIPAVDRL
jgi:hypothetical protein